MAERATELRAAPDPWDIGFGAVVFAGSLLAIFVWFPADIRGGFLVVNPLGKVAPGDAFFPTLLAVTLAILSAAQLVVAVFRGPPPGAAKAHLTVSNVRFLIVFSLVCAIGLLVMYGLGPVTVWLMRGAGVIDAEYRHLTDTAPYKYIGYVVGGFLMTVALIVWTEGRLRRTGVIAVVVVLVSAIIIFDKLLTNVLLPPNAEF